MEIMEKSKTETRKEIMKEDLERYYIYEKKTMAEISIIYGCSIPTIERRLIKYGIEVRSNIKVFAEDGKSLQSKYRNGEISAGEYQNTLIVERGFDNIVDYQNELARKKGFNDNNDYRNRQRHIRGDCLPMSKNKKCPKYLGVHICENKEFISKIINIVESMQCNNPGYDFLCGKGKKIDVKCACLSGNGKKWGFHIRYNKVANYFLMIAFDDLVNLNIQHIWLVRGDSVIEKTKTYLSEEFVFNEKDVVTISKGNKALERWKNYEKTNMLKEAQKICDSFKEVD